MGSNVNHPDHYNLPGKKECIEQMIDDFGNVATSIFDLLSAYKYLCRAGHKPNNPFEQDIQKANWYIDHVEQLGTLDNEQVMPIYQKVMQMKEDKT